MQIFFDLFSKFWYVPMMALYGIGGFFLGNYLARPRHNQVLVSEQETNRGAIFDIVEESPFAAYTKPLGTFTAQHIIKHRPPFTVLRKGLFGRNTLYSIFLAKQGTAYSQRLENGEVQKLKLSDTLKGLWGQQFYNTIPLDKKAELEESKVTISVALADDPLTPKDEKGESLPIVSNADLKREEDRRAAENLWQEFERQEKAALLNSIMYLGTGSAITFAALLFTGKLAV